jgi:hypothetical protein
MFGREFRPNKFLNSRAVQEKLLKDAIITEKLRYIKNIIDSPDFTADYKVEYIKLMLK